MSDKYCEVCGESLSNEENFIADNGIEMCQKCYSAFQSETDYTTDYEETEDNNEYINTKNSNGNIWTKYLKKMCYVLWGIITITGALTGNTSFSFIDEDAAIIGIFAGGMIGFIAGFASIAIVMAFITLCENISVMNKNTEEILNLLKDKK